jgi:hypothetical protein
MGKLLKGLSSALAGEFNAFALKGRTLSEGAGAECSVETAEGVKAAGNDVDEMPAIWTSGGGVRIDGARSPRPGIDEGAEMGQHLEHERFNVLGMFAERG